MAIDPAPVGILAAALMEEIERDHGEGVTLRAAIVVVDIGHPDADGDMWTHVVWKMASAGDAWEPKVASSAYAAGIVAQALVGLTDGQHDGPE